MACYRPIWARVAFICLFAGMRPDSVASAKETSHNWVRSAQFDETTFTETLDSKIRIHVNAPLDEKGQPARGTRLVVYSLPAGNTIEQTLGCKMKPGLHWRYDIQHVAAQIRLLRSLTPNEKIVLICPEGPGLSWTPFRKAHPDANARMAKLVDQWRKEFGATDARVMLTGHSNGGSFMFGVVDGAEEIPAYIDRIAFLDSNYNFQAAAHAAKFEQWLKGDDNRYLVIIAYDDREITLNGKKVLQPGQGTFNATKRMRESLGRTIPLADKVSPPFRETIGLNGRLHFFVHPNPENKILHTILVGEMNGLVHAATLGTENEEKWGKFGGPRAYMKWVQAEPNGNSTSPLSETDRTAVSERARTGAWKSIGHHLPIKHQTQLPPRSKDAMGGSQFVKSLEGLNLDDREAAIFREIVGGNFPEFLRDFKLVPIQDGLTTGGKEVTAALEVMPDYLAIGSNADFVRMPMTPQTAQRIADRFKCTLPTRKIVDEIDRFAELNIAPHPMTENREAIATFAEHSKIIEQERGDKPLGLLLVGGKKDIVLTPRIFEKPQRLAIYGWRQLNGKPIQPLTIVHWNRYVDYSHGVRLVRNRVVYEGKETVKISDLLADPKLCGLVSDEGLMDPPRYPADWKK
jgi:hypothetical protein